MRGDTRPWTCPQCGFNYLNKSNYSKKINEILKDNVKRQAPTIKFDPNKE